MKIGINASFLRKPGTGIGQVSLHFLRTLMEDQEFIENNDIFLYVEQDIDPALKLSLPQNAHQRVFLPLWKRDDLARKLLWEKFYLPRAVAKDKCDVLLSLYQSATVITSTSTKHAMIVHDIIPKLFPEYIDNIRKSIYQGEVERGICSANTVITVSQHTCDDLIAELGIKEKKVTVAHIAVDPIFETMPSDDDIFAMRQKYTIAKQYLYTGGGLEVRKNVEGTLRAYAQLIKNNQQLTLPQLVISGRPLPGNSLATDVDALVQELDIEEHVRVIGFVDQEDLPALYAGALFFCFPTHYEGFGMPVLEAMHMRTPVLTAKNSSLPEVGGEAVLYCDNNAIDDISAKMKLLLSDDDLRAQLAQKGYNRAQQFSWKRFKNSIMRTL